MDGLGARRVERASAAAEPGADTEVWQDRMLFLLLANIYTQLYSSSIYNKHTRVSQSLPSLPAHYARRRQVEGEQARASRARRAQTGMRAPSGLNRMHTHPLPQTTPFLLRVYIKPGAHSEPHLFDPSNAAQQRAEHALYVWKDCTLRELVTLLRSVNPGVLGKGNARFSVRHVYAASSSSVSADSPAPSTSDRRRAGGVEWEHRDLGLVFARDLTGGKNALSSGAGAGPGAASRDRDGDRDRERRSDPSTRTLEQHRFIPGDYLEIVYSTPQSASSSSGPGGAGAAGAASGSGTIPSLSIHGRAGLGSGFGGAGPGRSNGLGERIGGPGFGMSEADQAWGIAGENVHRSAAGPARHPGSRDDRPYAGGRQNPLLTGRGGISILGQGRRRSGAQDDSYGRLKQDDAQTGADATSARETDGAAAPMEE